MDIHDIRGLKVRLTTLELNILIITSWLITPLITLVFLSHQPRSHQISVWMYQS